MSEECCACLNVKYLPLTMEDSVLPKWKCQLCRREFWPAMKADRLRNVVAAARKLLEWHQSEHFGAVSDVVRRASLRGSDHLPGGYVGCAGAVDELEKALGELNFFEVQDDVEQPSYGEVQDDVEQPTHLLVGRRGNAWSDKAEQLLFEAGIDFRFEEIKTPPHPNPSSIEGADDNIRAIPTLMLDYYTTDQQGDRHHFSIPLAWGLEEVEKWLEADKLLKEQNRDV